MSPATLHITITDNFQFQSLSLSLSLSLLKNVQNSSQIITTNKTTSSFYTPDKIPVTQPTVSQF